MSRLPSFRQLDDMGVDAGPYLDGVIDELERAVPANELDRKRLERTLRRAERLHHDYFGGAPDAA